MSLLRPDGVLCMVGLPSKVSFSPMKLVLNRLSVTGSYLASHAEIVEMLTFCADNNITVILYLCLLHARGFACSPRALAFRLACTF
jgi:D-arabinose 1-dehydrogenase-like Zn-dependent alcohol dehydrogenase